jgi:hypothetical protein
MPPPTFLTFIAPEPEAVDPFSTEYWAPSASSVHESPAKKMLPRQALTDKTAQVNLPHPAGKDLSKQLKAARHVPAEDMEKFKSAVVGQDLTKVAMIEHLKKQSVHGFTLDQADVEQVPETAQRCDCQHSRRHCGAREQEDQCQVAPQGLEVCWV